MFKLSIFFKFRFKLACIKSFSTTRAKFEPSSFLNEIDASELASHTLFLMQIALNQTIDLLPDIALKPHIIPHGELTISPREVGRGYVSS